MNLDMSTWRSSIIEMYYYIIFSSRVIVIRVNKSISCAVNCVWKVSCTWCSYLSNDRYSVVPNTTSIYYQIIIYSYRFHATSVFNQSLLNFKCIPTWGKCIYKHEHTDTNTQTHRYKHTYIRDTQTQTHTYKLTYIYTHTHTYIYIYIYIYGGGGGAVSVCSPNWTRRQCSKFVFGALLLRGCSWNGIHINELQPLLSLWQSAVTHTIMSHLDDTLVSFTGMSRVRFGCIVGEQSQKHNVCWQISPLR